jgi:hydroxymethylbilane synthase
VTALVALPDGSEYIRDSASGDSEEAEAVGVQLARQLLDKGARRLLDEASAAHV